MQIEVRSDGSENVDYDFVHLPVCIHRHFISQYSGDGCLIHWHDDVEFIVVQEGHMNYIVNGELLDLGEGDGIFVNTRQLHRSMSKDGSESRFLCLRFHPMVLCMNPDMENTYLKPVLEHGGVPFIVLRQLDKKAVLLLDILQGFSPQNEAGDSELIVMSMLYRLWSALYELIGAVPRTERENSYYLSILRDMVAFLEANYSRKITLKDLCEVGKIGATSCCDIFNRYINQSPMSYLQNYRLLKAKELLRDTELTVTEICYRVGFSGSSYFSETFKKYYQCTPSQYRRKTGSHLPVFEDN